MEEYGANIPAENLENFGRLKLGAIRQGMEQSHNPYFKPSINHINSLMSDQTLKVIISPTVISSTTTTYTAMQTEADIGNGDRLTLTLRIPSHVLIENSPLEIACLLVHEETHMEKYQSFDNKNLHLSASDRRRALQGLYRAKEDRVKSEAEAYAKQAKAFIASIGQVGFSQALDLGEVIRATHLIKSGNNPDSSKFLAFIKDWLVGKISPR